jgi:hypothetical protein
MRDLELKKVWDLNSRVNPAHFDGLSQSLWNDNSHEYLCRRAIGRANENTNEKCDPSRPT